MESRIVLDTGCIGLLPFLVQFLIHFSDYLLEKCGKAVTFQTVNISLFRQLGFFQLFQTISKRILLGGQFFLFCFTAFLFCDLLPKLFQRRITHMECPFPALRFFVQKPVQKMLPIIYKCFGDNVAVHTALLAAQCRKRLVPLEPKIAGTLKIQLSNVALHKHSVAGILRGGDVMRHLEGCPQAVLLAVTLGPGVDAQIRRAGVGDIAAGVASDALGSALAEQAADAAEAELRQWAAKEGKYLTGRFSPGYGDWDIAVQPLVANALDTVRRAGLCVTDTNLMTPRKSVTAILGLSGHPVKGKLAGCGHCVLRTRCEYRKRGKTCASE